MAIGEIVDYGPLSASGAAEYLSDTQAVRQTLKLATQAVEQALKRQDQQFADAYNFYDEPANERFERIKIDGITVDQLLSERFKGANLDVYHRNQMGFLLIAKAQIEDKEVQVSPYSNASSGEPVTLGAANLTSQLVKPPIKLTGWESFWSNFGFFKTKVAEHAASKKQAPLRSELFDRLEATTLAGNVKNSTFHKDNEKLIATQTPIIQQMFSKVMSDRNKVGQQFISGIDPSFFNNPKLESGEAASASLENLRCEPPLSGRFIQNMGIMMMMEKGLPLEEAIDPTKHVDMRIQIGKDLGDLTKASNSKDPEIQMAVQKRFDGLLLQTSQKLLDMKAPSQEDMRTLKKPGLLYAMGYMSYDCYQEFKALSDEAKALPRYDLMLHTLSNLGRTGAMGSMAEGLRTPDRWNLPDENASAAVKAGRDIVLAEQTKQFLVMHAHAMSVTSKAGATLQELIENNQEAASRNSDLVGHYDGMLAELEHREQVTSFSDIQSGKVDIDTIIMRNEYFAETSNVAANEEKERFGVIIDKRAKVTLAENLVQKLGVDPVNAKAQFDKCTNEMLKNPSFEKLIANQPAEKLLDLSQKPDELGKMLQGIKPKISLNSLEKPISIDVSIDVSIGKEMQAQAKEKAKAPMQP